MVHHGLPWRDRPALYGNWSDPAGYRAAAAGLRTVLGPDKVVHSPGEIGILAFYCECQIVDEFSDQRSAVPLINQRIDEAGPLVRAVLQLDSHNLDRAAQPRVDFRLAYEPGWVSDAYTWNVWTPVLGPGHLRLLPA